MRKIFIILFLMLSIFTVINAHPFKTEKELYDYYAEIDKKINEELKNSPEKILKEVVCQIVLIKKFRLTINIIKRIFLRIKS